MESITITKDKSVIVCRAASFPDGVTDAFQQWYGRVPDAFRRTNYGISRPEGDKGNIVYKAAIDEVYTGEGAMLGLETMTVPAGHYSSIVIKDYRNTPLAIGLSFKKLLAQSVSDPEGFACRSTWMIMR